MQLMLQKVLTRTEPTLGLVIIDDQILDRHEHEWQLNLSRFANLNENRLSFGDRWKVIWRRLNATLSINAYLLLTEEIDRIFDEFPFLGMNIELTTKLRFLIFWPFRQILIVSMSEEEFNISSKCFVGEQSLNEYNTLQAQSCIVEHRSVHSEK